MDKMFVKSVGQTAFAHGSMVESMAGAHKIDLKP